MNPFMSAHECSRPAVIVFTATREQRRRSARAAAALTCAERAALIAALAVGGGAARAEATRSASGLAGRLNAVRAAHAADRAL